ncbi:MAG: hypothetical protein OES47_14105, partial [Acidobacteriota bacterium]|nr:hypothetical protein [Acidobacteriota bacterium]
HRQRAAYPIRSTRRSTATLATGGLSDSVDTEVDRYIGETERRRVSLCSGRAIGDGLDRWSTATLATGGVPESVDTVVDRYIGNGRPPSTERPR